MSTEPTLVTREHFRYIEARTVPEDLVLASLREEARAAGIPAISIGPAQAAFMQILLRAVRARVAVEVGTLAGYSAIALARALPEDGLLHTIEIDPARAAFARARFAGSGVADRIRQHEGDARQILPAFAAGSADVVFLDADKGGYPAYLEEAVRILRPQGLLLADNAFAFGELFAEAPRDPETQAMRAFNEILARDGRLASIIVPLGDGLWVAVKR
jgi:caffeoyl-CoA O-methyltransferase